jgi:hypothetical protein
LHVNLTDRINTMVQKSENKAKKAAQPKAKPSLAFVSEDTKNYENTAFIQTLIESISKGVVTLDRNLQHVLTGISVQLVCKPEPIHGVKLANDVLTALGTGVVRTRRVIWWLTTYTPLRYVKDAKGGTSEFKLKTADAKGNLAEMKAEFGEKGENRRDFITKRNNNPYSGEEFKAVKDASKEFNFNAELQRLIAKAAKFDKKLTEVASGKTYKNFDPTKVDLGIFKRISEIADELPKEPATAVKADDNVMVAVADKAA